MLAGPGCKLGRAARSVEPVRADPVGGALPFGRASLDGRRGTPPGAPTSPSRGTSGGLVRGRRGAVAGPGVPPRARVTRAMDLGTLLSLFTALDLLAVGLLLMAWAGIGLLIEHPRWGRRSVTVMMSEVRREWMRQLAQRDVRIFDSQIVGSLRQGTAFFASTSILAIGGLLTVLGNTELIGTVTGGLLADPRPAQFTQVKLFAVAVFLVEAFLRFVWSNRVFGYCAVVMAAVPAPGHPDAFPVARQAAELNIRAAYNFNRGLRSIYFALAALTWIAGAVPLMIATGVCIWVLLEREFASSPYRILREREARE